MKILIEEKNTLEMELEGVDQSLVQLISEKLNEDKDVEFASFKVEHPILGSPKLIVKTKKGDATKLVLGTLAELKKEVADFKKQFLDISK